MKYDGVIFDFDGTLADSVLDVWESVEYGAALAGGSLREEFKALRENAALPLEKIMEAAEPSLPKEKLCQFEEDIRKHYRKINRFPNTVLYPGIYELLEELKKKKIPCYIVSAKPEEALERVLKTKGWHTLFQGWFSVETKDGIIRTKAQTIRVLLQNNPWLKAPVYVGDTYTDVIAARENGIECIGVLYGDGNSKKIAGENPDYLVENSWELGKMLL